MRSIILRGFLTTAALAIMAGCATVPDPIAGERYSELPYPAQTGDAALGAEVRWGGSIVETRPLADRTCIEILAQRLDRQAYPRPSDDDLGRFLACREEFIDPEIFVNGRSVTVVGELDAFTSGKVGDFDYRYPRVAADAVYLWPEQRYNDHYYGYGYYGYGYPYYWPYYRFPYYGFGHGFGYYRPYHRSGLRGTGPGVSDQGSVVK